MTIFNQSEGQVKLLLLSNQHNYAHICLWHWLLMFRSVVVFQTKDNAQVETELLKGVSQEMDL